MAEYIEREALLNRLKTKVKRITPIEESRDMFYHDSGVNGALTRAMLEAENAPAADVVPVVHGRWELGKVEPGYFTPGGNRPWICSECGYLASWMLDRPTYNYCPNCGAHMREVEGDG